MAASVQTPRAGGIGAYFTRIRRRQDGDQFGQNQACSLCVTYWPKDLRQEGVGTNCHNAGLGEVGTDAFIQIHHLLQLLDCLQWEDPASNRDLHT